MKNLICLISLLIASSLMAQEHLAFCKKDDVSIQIKSGCHLPNLYSSTYIPHKEQYDSSSSALVRVSVDDTVVINEIFECNGMHEENGFLTVSFHNDNYSFDLTRYESNWNAFESYILNSQNLIPGRYIQIIYGCNIKGGLK